jgi:hypothetical protein
MSSLVDYGSSDESENESANDDSKPVIESELPVQKETENNGDNRPASQNDPNLGLFSSLPPPKPSFTLDTDDNRPASQNEDPNLGLFSSLPPPKSSFTLDTDADGLIVNRYKHPKGKEPVKIIVPSLSEVNVNINFCQIF